MSKRRRKLPQIELPFASTRLQLGRIPPEPEKSRTQQRKAAANSAEHRFLLKVILAIIFIWADAGTMDAFMPLLDRIHRYDFRLVLYGVCAFFFSAIAWSAAHQANGSWVLNHSQWHYIRRVHTSKTRMYWVMLRTYVLIAAVHLVAVLIIAINVGSSLDPEVPLHTAAAIGMGIAVQIVLGILLFVISRVLDFLAPLRKSPYEFTDDGEIDHFSISEDNSRYVLNDDGEIEKAKRSE